MPAPNSNSKMPAVKLSSAEPPCIESNGPADPRSLSLQRRWAIAALISIFTFISPMSSSIVAPALDDIGRDLHITGSFTKQLVLSIYLLLHGVVPVLIGPISELYGRIAVLQLGNAVFIIFNTACGVAQTPAQMLVFRALSGLGGGAPLAIGAAVIGDLFAAEERGTALAIYNMAPVLGPALGAVLGAAVTQYLSWHWIFYIVSILDCFTLLLSLLVLKETYIPVLQRRAQAKLSGNEQQTVQSRAQKAVKLLGKGLMRPLRMLATQPIIQLLAVYVAVLYGVMYLVLSTFPTLWTIQYNQSVIIGGLNFIALGWGYVFGTQICAHCLDRICRRLKERNDDVGLPEHRLPLAMFSFLLVPIGLIIYGWAAQNTIFWAVPDLGAMIFSMGTIIGMQCTSNYLLDAYPEYAASALGAVTFLRAFAGFGLPLFGP